MPTTTKPAKPATAGRAKSKGSAVAAAPVKAGLSGEALAKAGLPPARDGYKLTKLGWLPEEWEVKRGRDITVVITKGSSPRWQGFEYQRSGVLFVTSENVRDGFLDVLSPKFLPESFSQKQRSSILQFNDLLINIVGASIGRSCLYTSDAQANINQAVALVRIKPEHDPKYVSLFLQLPSTIAKLIGTQTESARPNLTLADLSSFEFILPPLPEQRRIAALLGTWDKAIATLSALIAAKQRRKQGLMQELLSGKRRFPGFNEKWNEVRLDKAFDFLRTTSYSRADLTNDPSQGTVAYIHYGDIHATYTTPILDLATNRDVPRLLSTIVLNGNTDYLRDGDLVIADASEDYEGVGSSIEMSNVGKRKVISGLHTMALRDKSGLTVPGFRAYMLREPIVANRMRTLATGSKVYGISKSNLGRLMLLLPSPEEQERIVSALHAVEAELAHLTNQLTHLTSQKRGLMQQLLTGAVRVRSV